MSAIAGIYIFLWFDFLHHRGEKQVLCVLPSTHPKFEKELLPYFCHKDYQNSSHQLIFSSQYD